MTSGLTGRKAGPAKEGTEPMSDAGARVRSKARKAAARSADPPPRRARLFQAKLRPPDVRGPTLARGAFPGRDALARARLVLVNAPAGFGKTTAICQYERMLRDGLGRDRVDHARLRRQRPRAIHRVPARRDRALRSGRGGVRARRGGAPATAARCIGEAFDLIDSVASSDRPLRDLPRRLREASPIRKCAALVVRLLLTLGPGQQLVIGTPRGPGAGPRAAARQRPAGRDRPREAALHRRGDAPLRARDPRLRHVARTTSRSCTRAPRAGPRRCSSPCSRSATRRSAPGACASSAARSRRWPTTSPPRCSRGCPTTCASSP